MPDSHHFRRQLKTVFYKAAFRPSSAPPQRLRFGWPVADIVRFTNLFSLLTYLLSYLLLLLGFFSVIELILIVFFSILFITFLASIR